MFSVWLAFMRDSASSDCALAVISFIGQLALFWKDACDKAKGSCRRKKRRNRLITSLVMVVDSFLRILRTLCIVFLRLCQFFRKKVSKRGRCGYIVWGGVVIVLVTL